MQIRLQISLWIIIIYDMFIYICYTAEDLNNKALELGILFWLAGEKKVKIL